MKRVFAVVIALFVFITSHVQAQVPGSVTVSGIVQDAANRDPLIKATVRLVGLDKSLGGYAVFTDNAGRYEIPDVLPGTYKISVQYIGYNTYNNNLTIDNSKSAWTLKTIGLLPKGKTLGTVTVSAKKPLV